MSDSSRIKNIILGAFFWLLLIVGILFFMRNCSQPESFQEPESARSVEAAQLSWFVEMKHSQAIFTHLKKAGYNAHLFYTYPNNERFTQLRVGPYTTRGKAKENMARIAKQFSVKTQVVSTLSTNLEE